MCPIGIQKSSADIHNLFISPDQHQSRCLRNNCHLYSFQIFFPGIFQEFFHVCRIYYNCHTLLGFGNGDFRSIQSGIFFRYLVQINLESVCQFSDSNGYTAGTKVITFFNQTTNFRSAEHTLNLSFCRCITFLYFGSTYFDRTLCMYFGRTGCSTDAITSGTATKQDNDISRI